MNPLRTLEDWLGHCDRLAAGASHTSSIERARQLRDALGLAFRIPQVTVAGTNGKGSTCAMLEAITRAAGYRVGVYQKPELVHFTERCRIDGAPVEAGRLLPHFEAVEQARQGLALSRYEFTTLAIARLLSQAELDLVVLEVGMGGRYDAVNAFDPSGVIITSIDLDHMEFLGPDREAIGLEKAQVMRPGRPAVVSDPLPPASVVHHAQAIGADLWLAGRDFRHTGDRQQWSWAGRRRRMSALGYPALRGANQLLNASGVLALLEAMGESLPVSAQAVRSGLAAVELPGRFQVLAGQPAIVLDVAHNPHSVAVLASNLDQMGFYPRTHAVFGAMADKDIPGMLAHMAPLVDTWHLCELPLARAARAAKLDARLAALPAAGRATRRLHPGPAAALHEAVAGADPADRIVVFGSFHMVGGVLREPLPRHGAPVAPPPPPQP
ncbi:MAG: bifunctional folylpolyglutamate synthase/dihydrofolate synthase [Rubrivivax sp.]